MTEEVAFLLNVTHLTISTFSYESSLTRTTSSAI